MATELMTRLRRQIVHERTVHAAAEERLEHDRQPVRGGVVHCESRCFQRVCAGGILQVQAQEELAEVEVRRSYRRGGVCGEAVVQLEGRPAQASPVHRTDDHLVVKNTEQEQVFEDVRSAENSVDARDAESRDNTLEQVVAVGHRERVLADAERAPRRMVDRDDEQLAVVTEKSTTLARALQLRDPFRVAGSGGVDAVEFRM